MHWVARCTDRVIESVAICSIQAWLMHVVGMGTPSCVIVFAVHVPGAAGGQLVRSSAAVAESSCSCTESRSSREHITVTPAWLAYSVPLLTAPKFMLSANCVSPEVNKSCEDGHCKAMPCI